MVNDLRELPAPQFVAPHPNELRATCVVCYSLSVFVRLACHVFRVVVSCRVLCFFARLFVCSLVRLFLCSLALCATHHISRKTQDATPTVFHVLHHLQGQQARADNRRLFGRQRAVLRQPAVQRLIQRRTHNGAGLK